MTQRQTPRPVKPETLARRALREAVRRVFGGLRDADLARIFGQDKVVFWKAGRFRLYPGEPFDASRHVLASETGGAPVFWSLKGKPSPIRKLEKVRKGIRLEQQAGRASFSVLLTHYFLSAGDGVCALSVDAEVALPPRREPWRLQATYNPRGPERGRILVHGGTRSLRQRLDKLGARGRAARAVARILAAQRPSERRRDAPRRSAARSARER
jgi:hypothetical protein